MKTITRILMSIFGVMMLLTTTSAMAQWTHVIAPVNESDISKVTKQSYQNYKGLTAATFEVIGSVEAVKEKGKVMFKLHTQSINMVKYNTYSYRPAPKLKNCVYDKLLENETNNYFSANQIGEASFEQAMRSASATFDVEITFIVKDGKYGIAGFGSEKGWGYRATRIFKNVRANGVFWADEPIETTFPIEEIKILNNPKLVSFQINDSGIQTAILDFVKKRNQETEDECKGKTKENEVDNKKKDEEDKKAEASAKEIEAMKNKLQNQSSVTIKSSTKADDFWNGGADKNIASIGKDNDNFWSGHEEKKQIASNLKGTKDFTSLFNSMPDDMGALGDGKARMIDHFNKLQDRNDNALPKDTPDEKGSAWHVDQDDNLFFSESFGEAGRWMTTNLAVTTYASGEKIKGPVTRGKDSELGWAYPVRNGYWFDNGLSDKDYRQHPSRGLLYHWQVAVKGGGNSERVQGVCPEGWHLPTWQEWEQLIRTVSSVTGNYPVDGSGMFSRPYFIYGLATWWSSTRAPNHPVRGEMVYSAMASDGGNGWAYYKPSHVLYHVGNSIEFTSGYMYSIRCKCDNL